MLSRADPPRDHADDLKLYGQAGDVSAWDIRFDPNRAEYCERLPDGSFRLRVWAEPSLITMAAVTRDAGRITEWPMESIMTQRFTIWEAVIGPFSGYVELSLAALTRSGAPVYVTRFGVASAVERLDRWVLDSQSVEVPAWTQGAFIYQVFPERFANGDHATDPPGSVAWGAEPSSDQFQGGDLRGLTMRLDYLEWLGVELIYLSPVFASPSNHKYDTVDYMQVDPAFGGNEALSDLVESAHRRGLRVMLDASLNHVHPTFFAFADVVERGSDSEFFDWFVVSGDRPHIGVRRHLMETGHPMLERAERWGQETGLEIVDLVDGGSLVQPSYDTWYGVATMPRLNLANPGARAYALNVAEYWIREFAIDGWRMDVARYVDHDFWQDFRAVTKAANPDVHLISEIMGDAGAWLQGDTFDGTMNYTFRDLCLRFLAADEISGTDFLDGAARMVYQYSWSATLGSQNLIGSHDTPRFLTEANGESWRLRLATVLQFTMPGMPGVYYGDEMEMTGGDDPGSRGAFPWDGDPRSAPIAQVIHEFSDLRSRRRELVSGAWRPFESGEDHVAFTREGDTSILVIVNRGARPVKIDDRGKWSEVMFGDAVVDGSGIVVPARSAALLSG